MRIFAKRLIALEANGKKSAKITKQDTLDVCEQLRPQLVTLMGVGGFRALLLRALALASAEVPWLSAVKVKADGALEGLEGLPAKPDLDAMLEGKVALLTQLLGLLVAFIGENLTLRLVREAWPKATLYDLESDNEDQNEKAK
jgi:hypothetical protein